MERLEAFGALKYGLFSVLLPVWLRSNFWNNASLNRVAVSSDGWQRSAGWQKTATQNGLNQRQKNG